MRLILIILLTFPLITISCIDSSFQKEIQFVQSIIDQPDSIQSLIEKSVYFDTTIFMGGRSYSSLANYLRKDSLGDVTIIDYGYCHGRVEIDRHKFLDSTICVTVESHIHFFVSFYFKELNKQIKLKVISVGGNYGDVIEK